MMPRSCPRLAALLGVMLGIAFSYPPSQPMSQGALRDTTGIALAQRDNPSETELWRKNVLADIKDLQKEKEISEDEERKAQDDVQKITARYIAEIDKALVAKEADLMEI